MPMYQAICSNCGTVEILKPMIEPFPTRHGCGGKLARLFAPVPVHYRTRGYRAYDDGLKMKVGPERYKAFEAKRRRILDAMPRGGVDALED